MREPNKLTKTLEEYKQDPRLLNDPWMTKEDWDDELMVQHRAIQLMIHDELAGMTPEEESEYMNAKARADLAAHGLSTHLCNFSGQGKLRPEATAGY